MIRRLKFTDASQHKIYFRLLYESFRSRGSSPPEKRVDKADRRLEANILKAIKAISDPIGEEPKDGELDGRNRQLKDEGGLLELKQPEFSRLQKFLEETQWMAAMTDVAADLEDWFDAAEKIEGDTEDVKRPHRVGAK